MQRKKQQHFNIDFLFVIFFCYGFIVNFDKTLKLQLTIH